MANKSNPVFNPEAMLGNLSHVKGMIKRIRQKDGGVGSQEDELSLHRAISDIELLAEMITGLKMSFSDMQQKAQEAIAERDAIINDLKNTHDES